MAHKKGQGSIRNGRDSQSKRLGCKRFAGELYGEDNILFRQRSTLFQPFSRCAKVAVNTPRAYAVRFMFVPRRK